MAQLWSDYLHQLRKGAEIGAHQWHFVIVKIYSLDFARFARLYLLNIPRLFSHVGHRG